MMISGKDFCKKKSQKRLQLVFRATYFVIFLSKKVACKSALVLRPLLQRTQSYVAIDIHASNAHNLDDEPFLGVDKNILADLVKDRNFDNLSKYGGTKKLAATLETDEKKGISSGVGGIKKRVEVFGSNTYKKAPVRGFLSFLIEAFKDSTIIILLLCAALSLGFGIKQHGPKEGWYDGGSIIFAVALVLAVSAISNFRQSRQFQLLSSETSNIEVEVVRDGRRQPVSIFDVLVGDIVHLKTGCHIPADGLFLDGHSMKVDESSMTGESDQVEINETENPFLLSGTKVMDGYGRMLVTSVGMKTTWGQMMSTITCNMNEQTPLQARLSKLTSYIGNVGLFVAFLVLMVLMIRYFIGHTFDESGKKEFIKGQTNANHIMNSIVRIIATAVTIVVVTIPEGLPLAVTLTLAYSIKRMMADHALVRKLSACETMGSATTICTDKTGTLTLNQMKVTEFWLGKESLKEKISLEINPDILESLQQGVGLNTTGEVHVLPSSAFPEIFGSPIESALLSWAISDMQDPCRPEVKAAVESCRKAGVTIKMITGERMEKIDGILIMARSTPFDKLLMVQSLKLKGQVVVVTGDGTNDAPALKEADIGLSMGVQGTEVAKESSDVVILDDNFNSVVTVLKWGRCVYNNIQKFIQFQLTVNVAALAINFVAAVSSGEVPLTAVQLLWVNLIMDTLGALALATEPPTDDLMDKKPIGRTEPLITSIMWRNLIAQALYQVAVLLVLQFRGSSIFGVNKKVKDTLIFNSFVLCQLFNEFNARKLERTNIFEGILKNKLFIGIVGTTVVLQVIIVEFLHRFANTERLNWEQWLACIVIAALSWPIGWLVKCIPVSTELLSSRFPLRYTFKYAHEAT